MLYVLEIGNIIISLFILSVILHFCFSIKFLDRIFERIPKKRYLLLGSVVLYIGLIISMITQSNMYMDKYGVSVDAVVTDSTTRTETINYGEDEFGHSDVEHRTYYVITYEFQYNGKTYKTTRSYQENRSIGTIDTIKIDPNNPQDNNGFSIPIVIISIGGCLIILRIFIGVFKAQKIRKKSKDILS